MSIQTEFIERSISGNKRTDGRKLDDFRKVEIELSPTEKPEGVSRVRIGKTDVMVGVKMAVGQPFSDRPKEGVLMTGAEFSPLASPDFERGPPGEDCIELARVVDRGIRESKTIDLEKLCIEEGEKVWTVMVDIQVINHDGNLLDAAALGAISALLVARKPAYDGELIDYTKKTDPLPVVAKPVAVTAYKIADKLILDPTKEEEEAATAKLTVTTKDNGNICAIQKSLPGSMTKEEVYKAFDLSVAKGKELRKLLK